MPRKLKDDVRALGGNEDDMDLLKDVDSDAELAPASSSKGDRALSSDLSKFMKGLDFGNSTKGKGKAVASVDPPVSTSKADKKKTKDSKRADREKDHATPSTKTSKSQEKPTPNDKEKPKSESKKKDKLKEKPSEPASAPPASVAPTKKPVKIKFGDDGEVTIAPTPVDKFEVKPTASSSKGSFLLQPASNWYQTVPELPEPSKPLPTTPADVISAQSARAADLLAQDVARYESRSSASSRADAQFLSRVMTGGTLSDRLSALTLLAQESPAHNANALEQLRGLAKKKSRDQSLKAARAIVDWWIGGGAPERKLKYFRDQSLMHPGVTESHLAIWQFEDWLKKYFYSILQILEALSMDPLPYVRIQAVTFVFQLLRDKPEQEQNLLRLLVNKLGDNDRSVASRVSYHLMQVVQTHPQMKSIIINEVSASIFGGAGGEAKGASSRYYSVITFNQMVLSARESAVADRLMDLYFKLFREMLGEGAVREKEQVESKKEKAAADREQGDDGAEVEKPRRRKRKGGKKNEEDEFAALEESDSKMISAILTGINRALPFATLDDSTFNQHINTLFRITHEATFNISVQALMLIDHVVASKAIPSGADLSNRFYRTLYAALLDPRLPASGSKHALFLTLLFRAIKRDGESARACAFAKRVLQAIAGPVCAPGFACAALVMLGKLCQQRPEIQSLISGKPTQGNEVNAYEPGKREPLYAHAETTCLWELVPLLQHYHPSVALHAQQLRDGERLTGSPDVGLYSLASFLDRFVLKNPKKKATARGASAMQPSADTNPSEKAKAQQALLDLDEETLGKMDEDAVAPEQVFYHRFVTLKGERERKMAAAAGKKGKKKRSGSDLDSDGGGNEDDGDEQGSELDEDEVWKAMKASAPGRDLDDADNVDIDDDSDLELDMSDSDEDEEAGSQASGSDDEAEVNAAKASEAGSDVEVPEGDDSEGGDELEFMEDDEDVIGDDDLIDLADIMDTADSGDDNGAAEEWGGIGGSDEPAGKKRKRADKDESSKSRKRRLRDLPTFATFEDYQKMIDDAPEDNI